MISQKLRRFLIVCSIVWCVLDPKTGWGQTDLKARWEELSQQISEYDQLYYGEGRSVISDGEYDALLQELLEIERAYPEWVTEDSPARRPGHGLLDEDAAVAHKTPMLSMESTRDLEGLVEFDRRTRAQLGHAVSYCVEDKIDGAAVSLQYEQGHLVRALTRGDGQRGEDIANIVKQIPSVPQKLQGNPPQELEVRGEIYIPKDQFEKINAGRRQAGQDVFANARNLAAGALHLKDSENVRSRGLRMTAFGIGFASEAVAQTQKGLLGRLEEFGFQTTGEHLFCGSMKDIIVWIENGAFKQKGQTHEIDGIVIKVDGLKDQQALGATGRNVRGMIAYKFGEVQARTIVKEIMWQVGRTGRLTPVAVLEPVDLDGSLIQRASLHNAQELKRLDARAGDTVILQKAGRVIPKIIEVVDLAEEDLRPAAFESLKQCPVCSVPLEKDNGNDRCPNTACPGRIKKQIEYFAHRDRMNIPGLGPALIARLVDAGLVGQPADLYQLDAAALRNAAGMSVSAARNLVQSIQESKQRPFANFLAALGIRFVGKQKAKALAERFQTMGALSSASLEELQAVPGIGRATAESIFDFFQGEGKRYLDF